jgi:aerobic carbon-monoxide dehydrogenase large subunit
MSILGNRVRRVEDPALLTRGGTYVADVRDPLLDGAAHVAFVRSPIAHGTLRGVDTTEAAAMPGVVAVLSAVDLGLTPQPNPFNPAIATAPLALDRVRYVGEPIAVVIAETHTQAVDAAEAVHPDIDPMRTVVGIDAALAGDTLLYPDLGSNVAMDGSWMGVPPPTEDLFDGCDVVVRGRFLNQRLAPCPLEARSAACAWSADGRLHQWATSQVPHMLRDVLGQVYGGSDRVRVIVPDMGGGFGPKSGMHPEEIMLGGLAAAVGRPLRWSESRSESMVGLEHGRGQLHEVTIGGTRDGRVLAYRLEIVQDAGAIPGFGALIPLMLTRPMACGVYDIARVECTARAVVTNTTPVAAYRGAGRPEATAAIERAMDLFAAELGLDPVAVRRRNLIPAFATERATSMGTMYDCGAYESALDAALDHAGYETLRKEQQARRERGDTLLLGIGVSCYVEVTGNSASGGERSEGARLTVGDDGAVTVYTGTSPHGQGHDTSWAMIAADELGVPMDAVRVVHGDTDLVPIGGGTYGSRSAQQGGAAVQQASVELVAGASAIAADLLEAAATDVVLTDGRFHVAGTPARSVSWAEVAGRGAAAGAPLDVTARFVASNATYPFGTHVAVVEVDVDTGDARVVRLVACDDAGRILNPLIGEGQIHGGIAQGVAQALLEQVVYDDDGNPQTGNFATYSIISATELPMFEVVEHETPTPVNPLGAKGIGESGTIGSTPAVHSAVVDALAHLGVRHIEMPCTPERVWRAIRDAGSVTNV